MPRMVRQAGGMATCYNKDDMMASERQHNSRKTGCSTRQPKRTVTGTHRKSKFDLNIQSRSYPGRAGGPHARWIVASKGVFVSRTVKLRIANDFGHMRS